MPHRGARLLDGDERLRLAAAAAARRSGESDGGGAGARPRRGHADVQPAAQGVRVCGAASAGGGRGDSAEARGRGAQGVGHLAHNGDGRMVRGGEGRGGAAPRAAVRAVPPALRRHLQRADQGLRALPLPADERRVPLHSVHVLQARRRDAPLPRDGEARVGARLHHDQHAHRRALQRGAHRAGVAAARVPLPAGHASRNQPAQGDRRPTEPRGLPHRLPRD
mmetsp:Transcript_15611/g.50061  ORF Transcript_15611/g.50061 Transcript_15611/m.50061 type:complete len:222 (+) Transcript_15611:689-1354(+)